MIQYPVTYLDIPEEKNIFTSETVINEISKYWFNEINQTSFNKGYRFGLLVFGISFLLLTSKAVFASDSGLPPTTDGGANCSPHARAPEATKPKPVSLATAPTSDRGTF